MFKNLAKRFVQYGNTTSKVKVDDIFHAYHVASIWLKKVYPEFYSKEDVTQFYS